MRIPFNDLQRGALLHGDALRQAIDGVIASGRFVLGDAVAGFEQEFARYCGVAHCVGVGNGSDALEIALRAAGVAGAQDVLTVANAGMYSTIAIRALGARPIYVDVDPRTLTMDPSSLEDALSQRPAAVVVTHLYGRLAAMPAIQSFAGRAGVPMIEDCAQAHGARIAAGRAGSFGDLACFSFYPTKNLGALGDGGAVTTADEALAARVRALRQYGWRDRYEVAMQGGRNSRLDEIQAAVLRVKLPYLDRSNERRRGIARAYSEGIRHPRIETPDVAGEDHVAHLYVVRSAERESLRRHLDQAGVGTAVHYPIPDHRQPVMADVRRAESLPHTERACAEVLSLPCFPEMSDSEVEQVIGACNAWPG